MTLDNLDLIYAASWPKAIHDGNGTMQLFITNKASTEQREAIVNIFSGRAKGTGPFVIFASTMKYILEPQFVEVKSKIDGKKSSYSVPGTINVALESFKNPVTGAEQETKIQLPNGFIFKLADAAKSSVMNILTKNMNFDHSGKNAFVALVEYRGP